MSGAVIMLNGKRMVSACVRLIIRVAVFVPVLLFVIWCLGEHLPTPIVWFISGAMFNDFWEDSEKMEVIDE